MRDDRIKEIAEKWACDTLQDSLCADIDEVIDEAVREREKQIEKWSDNWFDEKRVNNYMWKIGQDELAERYLEDLKRFLECEK